MERRKVQKDITAYLIHPSDSRMLVENSGPSTQIQLKSSGVDHRDMDFRKWNNPEQQLFGRNSHSSEIPIISGFNRRKSSAGHNREDPNISWLRDTSRSKHALSDIPRFGNYHRMLQHLKRIHHRRKRGRFFKMKIMISMFNLL